MIDPSAFTPFYDHFLCNTLTKDVGHLTLISSRYLYTEFLYQRSYLYYDFFYNITNHLYGKRTSGILRIPFKGGEHVWDMVRLTNWLIKQHPAIIHFQWIPFPAIDKYFIRTINRVAPTILTVHDVIPYQNSPSSRLQTMNLRSAFAEFSHFIVHNQSSLTALMESYRIPPEDITVIPFGLFDHYHAATKQGKGSERSIVITFFGTIKPYKGIDILIKAYAQIPDKLRSATRIVIAGQPKMEIDNLKRLAVSLGIDDNIQWVTQFIPENELGLLLSEADIFVLPYKSFNAQSAALMTLIPYGKPLITSDIPGFREIIRNNEHGYIVPANNPGQLAQALVKIILKPADRIRMGLAVKTLAKKEQTWETSARYTAALYRRLLRTRHA